MSIPLLVAIVVIVLAVLAMGLGRTTEMLLFFCGLVALALCVGGFVIIFSQSGSSPPSWYGLIMCPVGVVLLLVIVLIGMRKEKRGKVSKE